MHHLQALTLIASSLLLAACANKATKSVMPTVAALDRSAPVMTVTPAPPTKPQTTTVTPQDASSLVMPTAATDNNTADNTPTQAEDDYSALYGAISPSVGHSDTSIPTPNDTHATYDPWERYNRAMHQFNVVIDHNLARPLANAYVHVVPKKAQVGVTNFFNNLSSPLTMVNQVLQNHPVYALQTLGRFLLNSTLGLGGLLDPASAAKIPRRTENFGQTLALWGWYNSRYFELPLFGPRTVRDTFGLAGDFPLSLLRRIDNNTWRYGLQGLQLVDTRARLLSFDNMRDGAVDDYALTRDAWLQRRNYQIQNALRKNNQDTNDNSELPDYLREEHDSTTVPVDAMPIPRLSR
ncbi:VacJ family lipoprotein [Xylella fastidiosa subsp. multiplex]|nr:VacJ family lipoprotein [Xylella fastidiosa subsp. multiplex]MBS9446985.1 VacJ family lipoprotein [Xylella fastidiosa subsp. multiplex]MBS9448895.1 VacJ family lipoprotein [Xylella fastidiosa subsp. multiplex]MBS9450709.1 VacJ family lipoprotein [Xylella fastidiosa subsp. multiplex]MBS9486312.1 VacJ family lipoprotein [Xylella fastidiosa subsp. multiplex]